MQIQSFTLGPVQTNCYLLLDEVRREALVIDPGFGPEPVLAALEGYKTTAILVTHGHWDHVYGVRAVKAATGAPVWISAIEQHWLTDPMLNRSGIRTDLLPAPCDGPPADRLLQEGDRFPFGGVEFAVLHTAGHSPGSLTFVTDGIAFSGDVLFRGSVGRTDLPGCDARALLRSIRDRLFSLPDETVIAPGHGPTTTVGRERERNPIVGRTGNSSLLDPQ